MSLSNGFNKLKPLRFEANETALQIRRGFPVPKYVTKVIIKMQ